MRVDPASAEGSKSPHIARMRIQAEEADFGDHMREDRAVKAIMPALKQDSLGFLRLNLRWLSAGFLMMLFSCFGQTFFIGLSANDLRAAFHLTNGGFGGLYMLATLASALTLPWFGRPLDRLPGWKVVRFTLPALALACVFLVAARSVFVLWLALFMLRLFGQGMMSEIAFTVTGRWFVANRGRAMALIMQGQQLGMAVLPLLVVLAERASGSWRAAWFASAALIILLGLPALLALMRTPRVPQSQERKIGIRHTDRDWTRSEVVRDRVFYLLLAGTIIAPFAGSMVFFDQDYLIALRGYDPVVFAGAFPVMSVATVLFGFLCGRLIDRFGALKLLPYFCLPLALATAALALIRSVSGVYLFMFIFGVSNALTTTVFGVLWPEVYGLAHLGRIRSLVLSVMVVATAVGPGLSGFLIDVGVSLPDQLLSLSGWCVIATILLTLAARHVRLRAAATMPPQHLEG